MKATHWLALTLACTMPVGLLGCQASAGPAATQPAGFGHVRGFVYGSGGKAEPLGGVTGKAGEAATTTARIGEPVLAADQEFADPAKDGQVVFVMHDFGDGLGPVPTERRRRQGVQSPDPREAYVYLRQGEYFFEGLPAGEVALVAIDEEVQTAPGTVTVTANATLDTADILLSLPAPVVMEDGSVPRVLALAGVEPAAGLGVSVTGAGEGLTLAFGEQPAEAAVSLRAYPGSGEVAIAAAHVSYQWQDASGQAQAAGPVKVSLAPVTAPAASTNRHGAPVTVKVPLAHDALKQAFGASPERVTATITFSMPDGRVVVDRVFDQLRAQVQIQRQ